MKRLENKIALITGGSRGMGAAEARRLNEDGAAVVIADVLDEEGEKLAKDLGDRAMYVHLDVRREEDWSKAIDATIGKFGRLDILVNNAGVQRVGSITEMPLEDFRFLQEVNLFGPFLGMRAAIPKMLQNGAGSIINISSLNGLFGSPGMSAYTAAKHGVIGMTKAAALELAASGVRVNAICPGAIFTPMALWYNDLAGFDVTSAFEKKIPMKRNGRAEEIAALVAFLASDEASYCTGSVFAADGGLGAGFSVD